MTADGYATEFDQLAAGAADKALSIVAALAQCPEPALRVVRAIVAELDRLRDENGQLRALLAECIDRLPGWAGVNDDAHGWYCRAKAALHLRPWELPAPPLTDEQEGE